MAHMISVAAYKVQRPFEAPFRVIGKWVRTKETNKALNKLSARQLQDIGIERCDIETVSRRVSA